MGTRIIHGIHLVPMDDMWEDSAINLVLLDISVRAGLVP